jgi:PAS domain S-box-containing protein
MELELSHLVDALPGLVWIALPDGRAELINRRWSQYTGLSLEQAIGRGWLSVIHPEDLDYVLERWRALLESGQSGEVEARLRRHDGEYRRFRCSTAPITDDSGRVARWCGINTDVEDHRRAEEMLRVQERRAHQILDGLPTMVTLMTPEGEFDRGNRHMLEYFGKPLEELRARPVGYSFHPDDRPEVLRLWRHSVETGEPYDHEARLRRADGVYRWFHSRGFPLRDDQGRIVTWYLLQVDIDERRRAEAVLAAEKQLLEKVARGFSLPSVLDDLAHLVEDLAQGCLCSILLVNPDKTHFSVGAGPRLPPRYNEILHGKTIDRGYGPCSLAVVEKLPIITADLANDPRWNASTWLLLMEEYGLRSCWSMPIFSSAWDVLGVFAIYREEPVGPTAFERELIDRFTKIAGIAIERAQGDAALKVSEAELRGAHAHLTEAQRLSQTGSFTWDVHADEHTWATEIYRIFGLEPGSKVTMPMIQAAIFPEDMAAVEAVIGRALLGEDFELVFRILTNSGALKHAHVVGHRSEHITDRPVFHGAIHDVTQSRVAEEALNRARSELAHAARVMTLGALTASIAHEVNQPLSGIITNASTCLRMLAADPPNIDGVRTVIQRTLRDGNRASEVIQRLRSLYTRKQSRIEPVDLNDAAREVLTLSSSELQTHRVILRNDFDERLPAVRGDRVQLQQVILNLVLNATDAMRGVEDRPRNLLVETAWEDETRIRLSVRDSGVGIDPQSLEKVFDAFYTTKSDGMGIGLAISRSIIESHEGRLWAHPNDGPGATFSFSIPCGSVA